MEELPQTSSSKATLKSAIQPAKGLKKNRKKLPIHIKKIEITVKIKQELEKEMMVKKTEPLKF
ncbi:hypothetical protein D3C87_131710 [compost metagenome]